MKVSEFFAGLATGTGALLLAGNVFAAGGYTIGDASQAKMIPYYKAEGTLATIIAVQNLSSRNGDTPKDETEHAIVEVNVFGPTGPKKEATSGELCLGENEFGWVVLQGDTQADEGEYAARFSSAPEPDGDGIPATGYVTLRLKQKLASCTGRQAKSYELDVKKDKIATWAIIQDVGEGFFGTEIPSLTDIFVEPKSDDPTVFVPVAVDPDNPDTIPPAYTAVSTATTTDDKITAYTAGKDDTSKTLDQQRADKLAATAPLVKAPLTPTTEEGDETRVFARYDVSEEFDNDIFVWLGNAVKTRTLRAVVVCRDGEVQAMEGMDDDGEATGLEVPVEIDAPNVITVIDPAAGEIGTLTKKCGADGRGLLSIGVSGSSTGTAVWSHISHTGKNFRQNFPGYVVKAEE